VGHGTRTCPAFNPANNKIVMFKDSWQVLLPDILPEGEIYKHLKDTDIHNIATCIACHDVPSLPQQRTQTAKFANAPWVQPYDVLTPHIHYCMVLNHVGQPLIRFTSSCQVVKAVRDALIAHEDACAKAGVLHRDLSLGNIVIYVTHMVGLFHTQNSYFVLNFSVAKGTWQFMSANLVKKKHAAHTIEDDLESSFYI
ncbi:uncharacterized protein F5147DRAFT_538197, partial [Suillus discolor]